MPTMPIEQNVAGEQNLAPEQNLAAGQALIAEARAHARRRRRKIALAVTAAAAVLSAAWVLAAPAIFSKQHAVDVTSAGPGTAIRTGTVVGHLSACYGMALPGRPLPVTPGTVTAIRGTVSWKRVLPGTWRMILPNGPVVARAHISDNYHQVFRFALPPGKYVLIGRYDKVSYPRDTAGTTTEISVNAGETLHADLPNDCK